MQAHPFGRDPAKRQRDILLNRGDEIVPDQRMVETEDNLINANREIRNLTHYIIHLEKQLQRFLYMNPSE
jgi:hypothetical protein